MDSNEIRKRILLRAKRMPELLSSKTIINRCTLAPQCLGSDMAQDLGCAQVITSNCGVASTASLHELCRDRRIIFIVTTAFEDTTYLAETLSSIWSLADPGCPVVYVFKDASNTSLCKELVIDFAKSHSPICPSFTCIYLHLHDRGMYHGLKQAFDYVVALLASKSSLLTYINADDRLYSHSAALAADIFSTTGIHWLTGYSSVIDHERTELFSHASLFHREGVSAGLFLGKVAPFIQQEGTFWTLDLYERVRGFNPDLELAGDLDLWMQFSELEEIYTVSIKMASFRKRPGQKSENIAAYHDESSTLPFNKSVLQSAFSSGVDAREWPVFYGYAVSDSRPHAIGRYFADSGTRLVPKYREIDDPAFSYPVTLGELESQSCLSRLIAVSRNTAHQDIHKGVEGLDIDPDPSGFYYYTCLRPGQPQWFDAVLDQTKHLPMIIKIRLVCIECAENARARVMINNIERIVELGDCFNLNSLYNDFIDIRFFQPACEAISIRVELVGCSYGFASISTSCFLLPSSFGTYRDLHDALCGWPYLSKESRPLYKKSYIDLLPKISIIVPTYNQGETIRDTLASLYSQYYPHLQVILLDGFSTDSTRSIISDFLSFISEVRSYPDTGQSAAISQGIAMARGEIITWLNTDDLLAPNALFKAANHYLSHRDADVIVGNCIVFKRNEYVFQHSPQIWEDRLDPRQILDIRHYWLKGKYFHQPECFFTRSAVNKVVDTCRESFINESLYYSMDYDIWAKMAISNCLVTRINTPLAIYRMSDDQKTSSVDRYLPELEAHSSYLLNKHSTCLRGEDKEEALEQCRAGMLSSWSDLRVLMFNDVGFFGGAGIAHQRIAQSLLQYGVNVKCVSAGSVWAQEGHEIDLNALTSLLADYNPHLIICGNVHGIRTDHIELLRLLSSASPCWFVAHDFWMTNGSIPYPSESWQEPVDFECPEVKCWVDKINSINNLFIIPNSTYSRRVFAASGLKQIIRDESFRLSVINESVSRPQSNPWREASDSAKVHIVIGSVGLLEPRKGADIILGAISLLDVNVLSRLRISSYGFSPISELESLCEYFHHGLLPSSMVMNLMSQADIFISMSSIETFGQTSVEALKEGLYLIVTNNGGSMSFAVDGFNSSVIDRDPIALADSLSVLVDSIGSCSSIIECSNRSARSLSVEQFSLLEQGYSLLRCIVTCTSIPYPVGGQRVRLDCPGDDELTVSVI